MFLILLQTTSSNTHLIFIPFVGTIRIHIIPLLQNNLYTASPITADRDLKEFHTNAYHNTFYQNRSTKGSTQIKQMAKRAKKFFLKKNRRTSQPKPKPDERSSDPCLFSLLLLL